MKKALFILPVLFLACSALAGRAKITPISNDPYTGAIVVDGISGEVIFEDGADRKVYPASVVKLMDMLIILEMLEEGRLKPDQWIHVTAEASKMGGSQVYLKEGETFTLDEMLYALSIKSANDVAVALAVNIAGTTDNFVKLMNERAAALGLESTEFHSVHGLPPSTGQKPDVSTPRDIAKLSLEIVKHPKALHYTATKEKWFRNNTFEMLTHNRLLHDVPGCDGLKTGYFRAGGFSISATAERDGRRVIAVVMGCKSRPTRDQKTRELLSYGFMHLPELRKPESAVEEAVPETPAEDVQAKQSAKRELMPAIKRLVIMLGKLILGLLGIMVIGAVIFLVHYAYVQKRDSWKYKL